MSGQLIPFGRARGALPRQLRADVPPFDPGNETHVRAWEKLYDLGRLRQRLGDTADIRR